MCAFFFVSKFIKTKVLIPFSPNLAKGRTNVELREQFTLASGVSQSMTAFKSKSKAEASPNSSVSSQSGQRPSMSGPITKVQLKLITLPLITVQINGRRRYSGTYFVFLSPLLPKYRLQTILALISRSALFLMFYYFSLRNSRRVDAHVSNH